MDPLIPVRQPAPAFILPSLNGDLYSLKDWQVHVLIINFWSAECPWAERADRELLSITSQWENQVFLWTIASNANEPRDLLARVSEARGLPFVLLDVDNQVADLYGAQITPHIFVIDRCNILRYQGALDDITFHQRISTRNFLQEAIQAILSGKQPDPENTQPYGCAIVRYSTDPQ